MLSLIRNCSGSSILTGSPRLWGLVKYPLIADAAAVSGLTRYTCPSAVPLRPSKFRLKVRRDTPSHTDARAAGTFQHSCACSDNVSQGAVECEHIIDLLGAAADG